MGSDLVSSTVHHSTSPTHSTVVEEVNGRSSPESDQSLKLSNKTNTPARKPTFVILGAIPEFYQTRISKRKELCLKMADFPLPKFAQPKCVETELNYLNEITTPPTSPKSGGKSFKDKLKALDEKFKEIPQLSVGISQMKNRSNNNKNDDKNNPLGLLKSDSFSSSLDDIIAKRLKSVEDEKNALSKSSTSAPSTVSSLAR